MWGPVAVIRLDYLEGLPIVEREANLGTSTAMITSGWVERWGIYRMSRHGELLCGASRPFSGWLPFSGAYKAQMTFAVPWNLFATAAIRIVQERIRVSLSVGVVVAFERCRVVEVQVSLDSAQEREKRKTSSGEHVERSVGG